MSRDQKVKLGAAGRTMQLRLSCASGEQCGAKGKDQAARLKSGGSGGAAAELQGPGALQAWSPVAQSWRVGSLRVFHSLCVEAESVEIRKVTELPLVFLTPHEAQSAQPGVCTAQEEPARLPTAVTPGASALG